MLIIHIVMQGKYVIEDTNVKCHVLPLMMSLLTIWYLRHKPHKYY